MSPRSSSRLLAGVLAAAALCSAQAAQAAPLSVLTSGAGLTAPLGMAVTPSGDVWVADGALGVCRVRVTAPAGPVPGAFCDADHAGPGKPEALVHDPVNDVLYAADGASNGAAVWRLGLDGHGAISSATRIAATPEDQVMGLALVPGGAAGPDLVFSTKRSAALRRISDPAGTPGAPRTFAFARARAATEIAYLDGQVYVAEEESVVTRVALDGSGDRVASVVPGLPGMPTALAVDPERHRLYVGTTNGSLADTVEVLDAVTGDVELYERGLTGVTALAPLAGGALLAADDPGDATGALDSAGQGRLWQLPLRALRRPAVRISSGPAGVGNATTVRFSYTVSDTVSGGAAVECRLDDAAWQPCSGGAISYDGVDDGVHRFSARAADVDGAAPAEAATRTFVVDTRAPVVTVAVRAGAGPGHDGLSADLLADEAAVALSCRVDAGEPFDCDAALELAGLAAGDHVLEVTGTDPAGNVGRPARTSFEVAPAAAPAPSPAAGSGSGHGTSIDEARPAPAPQAAADEWAGRSDERRVPQDALMYAQAPAPFAPAPSAAWRARSRTVRIAISVPAGARRARIVIFRGTGRDRAVVREVAVRPGARNRLLLTLTGAEARRLRAGRNAISVSLSGRPGAPAPAAQRAHVVVGAR